TPAFTIKQGGIGDIFNLLDGNTEVLTVLDGGNVGIGTSTPSYLLDIDGDLRVGEAAHGYALFVDATNEKIGLSTSTPTGRLSIEATAGVDSLVIGSSTATYFKVDKNGNVGIGTANPGANLEIYTGAVENTFKIQQPNLKFVILRPNAAGTYEEFDERTGCIATEHWKCSNEGLADDTSTHVETDTQGAKDTYNLTASGLAAGSVISSVTVYVKVSYESAGDTDWHIMIRSGSTNATSTVFTEDTSWFFRSNTWATDPNTGAAWTIAAVDALQAGGETDSSAAGGVSITQVYAVVEYSDPTDIATNFIISSDNKIGIGTSSPAATLDISGDLRVMTEPTASTTDAALDVWNRADSASNQVAIFRANDRPTAANDDQGYLSFYGDDELGSSVEFGRMLWEMDDVSTSTKDATLRFFVEENNSLVDTLTITGSAVTVNSANLTVTGSTLAQSGYISGTTALSDSGYALGGASNGDIKFGVSNNDATIIAGDSAASLLVNGRWSEASSGNHSIIANLAVKPLEIDADSATVSNTASLYIEGAADSTVVTGNNYALWVDAGVSRFDGNVGIGTSSPAARLSISGGSSPMIMVDAPSGFTNNLFDLKVASSSVFTINHKGTITTNLDVGGMATITASTGNINTEGNILVGGSASIVGVIRTGGAAISVYNHFGAGGTANFANDDASDVYIQDQLEVDGNAYFWGTTLGVGGMATITAATGEIQGNKFGINGTDVISSALQLQNIATLDATTETTIENAMDTLSNVTSLGTLTSLTVDNVIINGATIGHTSDADLLTLASGQLTIDGVVSQGTTTIPYNASYNLLYGSKGAGIFLPNNSGKVYAFAAVSANTGMSFDFANSTISIDKSGSGNFIFDISTGSIGDFTAKSFTAGQRLFYDSSANKLSVVAAGGLVTSTIEAGKGLRVTTGDSAFIADSFPSAGMWFTAGGEGPRYRLTNTSGTTYHQFLLSDYAFHLSGIRIGATSTDNEIDRVSTGSGSATLYIGNRTISTAAIIDGDMLDGGADPTIYGLSDLMQIEVVDFQYKPEFNNDNSMQTGIIAQQLQGIYPKAVKELNDGLLTVDNNELIPLIIQSVQDQQEQIDIVQDRVVIDDVTGNVGIGIDPMSQPSGQLHVAGGEVVIGTGGEMDYVSGDGDLYVQNNLEVDGTLYQTGADIAELYPSLSSLEVGDVVMADVNNEGYITKATGELTNLVMGVISSEPSMVLASGSSAENQYQLTLVGRVAVKATAVNGPIGVGDQLTIAPLSGYAMKLNQGQAGPVIGTALQSLTAGQGLINMFVNLNYNLAADRLDNATKFGSSGVSLFSEEGTIALNALPVEIALLQGETQTFTGNYIFGEGPNTSDLIILNSKIASNINFAVDDLYNIGSEENSAAGIYVNAVYSDEIFTEELQSDNIFGEKLIIDEAGGQGLNLEDYSLYLSGGLAYFGGNVGIGEFNPASSSQALLLEYPEFALDGGDLYVIDNVGIGGDVYVAGNIKVAGAIEYQGQGTAQYFTVENIGTSTIDFGTVILVSQATSTDGFISDEANSTRILGIVGASSAEIFGAGSKSTSSLPIIVYGTALVNVSAENGPINKGDKLTTAATNGYAMLATKPGAGVLGAALEPLNEGEAKIKVFVDLGTYFEPLAEVITVGKKGADFKTISQALDSIEDNSLIKRYLIEVAPGFYEEKIITKDFVDIVGAGEDLVTVISDEQTVLQIAGNSRVEGITFESVSSSIEPVIVSVNSLSSTTKPILKNLTLLASGDEPAIGVSISGQPQSVLISNLTLSSNFYQGITNLASTTVRVMSSDLSQVNGTALVAQNGLVKSSYSEINGALGDIYISPLARVESKDDHYKQVTNMGSFTDISNRGKIADNYIDYGWLAEKDEESFNPLTVKVSNGQGYINGVKVNTANLGSLALNASSTSYIFIDDSGILSATTASPTVDNKTILIAQVYTAAEEIVDIINERTNEVIVAKEGGQYRSIQQALNSITTNSANNRWVIKVGQGVYNEQIQLKPFVDIAGSGRGATKIMAVNKPVALADFSSESFSGLSASTSLEVKISDLELQLSNDNVGQPVVQIFSSEPAQGSTTTIPANQISLEDLILSWSGDSGVESTGVAVSGRNSVKLNQVVINDVDYGVSSEILSDNSATTVVEVAFSSVNAKNSDIRTVCLDAQTAAECTEETAIEDAGSTVHIISSYNTLSGKENFTAGKGTVISSSHDTYLSYSGEGEFRQKDYFRNITGSDKTVFALQNAGADLFTVSASGTIAVSPQNTSGDSFSIIAETASSTLMVVNNGSGPALTVVGDLILRSATSTMPVTIAAAGGEINVGAPGDTINLNIEGVTYNFKENVRRNVLSAYLAAPISGDKVWGSQDNSWNPPENITVLAVKVQYECYEGGMFQLALKDKQGNTITDLNGWSCDGYQKMVEDQLNYPLTPDDGMYIDIITATEGIKNVTITIEYIYENR
ncbi:hypothetical protein KJ840_01355, partial [Patescibacteria group bacterium]|nr:hypothetical protein [Patescibacteria group bacterium]